MLTKDDLHAIGELLLASEKRIRQDMVTKDDLAANNLILGTIVRAELAATKQEIVKAMKAGFQAIVAHEQKQDKTLKDHETRIHQLEEDNKFLPR